MPARRSPQVGSVYLLHFSRAYYHARHYAGFAIDVDRRVKEHLRGRGSPLISAAVSCGIEVFIARQWTEVTRAFERRLHLGGHHPLSCPICRGPRALGRQQPRRDPATGIGL